MRSAGIAREAERTALEGRFPIVEISEVSEHESWRKEINRPLYHIHKWWATRLGSVFRAITLGALSNSAVDIWKVFYERHNFVGKTVLDPFMGSGTTLGEALKLGARAVGCDINPVSTFLVKQAFSPVGESALRQAFQELEKTVAPEIQRYYQTRDPRTGAIIPVLYYFWVKTVSLPDGETVPLFSRYVFAQDAYPQRKPRAHIICPNCWGILEGRFDSVDISCAQCDHRFNPQDGPASGQYVRGGTGGKYRIRDLLPADGSPLQHRLYAVLALSEADERVYLPAGPHDHALFEEAERRLSSEDLPLPTLAIRPGHNTNQARSYNYRYWREFFNSRQLLCLGVLLREILRIEDKAVQEQMLCLFSSTLEFNNLFCSFKGEGTGAVRHMFSHHILKPERTPLENSVWGVGKSSGTFRTLFESRLIPAKKYLDEPFEVVIDRDLLGARNRPRKCVVSNPIKPELVNDWREFENSEHALMIRNGDSASLPLPDKCIDAVVTDPPYFDFVHYSELSDFFFAWLSPVLRERYSWMKQPDSSGVGEVQHKDVHVFSSQLSAVFAECNRVLKDDGVLAFSFHHSREDGWAAIYEAVANAGLAVVAAHPVHAELRAASPKTAARDPISLDAILVCRKRATGVRTESSDSIGSRTIELAATLEKGGIHLSPGDRFVIAASQLLVDLGPDALTYEEILKRLQDMRFDLADSGNPRDSRPRAAA
jgi:putative DNA methylase